MKNKKRWFSWKSFGFVVSSYLFTMIILPAVYVIVMSRPVTTFFNLMYLANIVLLFVIVILPLSIYKGFKDRSK